MNDLIKREDAIEAYSDIYWIDDRLNIAFREELDKIDEKIRNIPTVEIADRPQGWIPCSERLPSKQGQYLVTFPLYNGEPWVYILSFNKGKFYETDDEWGDVEYDDVTAWMPLPKPWKGADDEDNH